VLLAIAIVIEGIVAAANHHMRVLLSDPQPAMSALARGTYVRAMWSTRAAMFGGLVAAVLLAWVLSLYRDTETPTQGALRSSDKLAVAGAFFIPPLCYFAPYFVFDQMRLRVAEGAQGAARWLLGAWWGAFALGKAASLASLVIELAPSEDDTPALLTAPYDIAYVSSLLHLVAAALGIRVIAGLDRRLRGVSTSLGESIGLWPAAILLGAVGLAGGLLAT